VVYWPSNCQLVAGSFLGLKDFGRSTVQDVSSLGGMMDNQSHLTRRSLLDISWRSLVVAGVARGSRWIAFAAPARHGLENATAESFAPHLGETFGFLKPAGERGILSPSVELRLTTVARHENLARIEAGIPAIRGRRKRESFSLFFELPGHEPLGPGLHEFARGEFQGCPLFLSRVQSVKNHEPIFYEAVFG
jgi:hypothetical protein